MWRTGLSSAHLGQASKPVLGDLAKPAGFGRGASDRPLASCPWPRRLAKDTAALPPRYRKSCGFQKPAVALASRTGIPD